MTTVRLPCMEASLHHWSAFDVTGCRLKSILLRLRLICEGATVALAFDAESSIDRLQDCITKAQSAAAPCASWSVDQQLLQVVHLQPDLQ